MKEIGDYSKVETVMRDESQKGIALITVLLLLVTMTILGIAAITVTGMENRMAGFTRSGEAAGTAAEACLDTGLQVVQQTLDVSAGGSLPPAFRSDAAPAGPVPGGTPGYNTLNAELLGQDNNNADTPSSSPPNLTMTLNNYTVNGDIDRLYVEPKPGTSQAFDEQASGNAEIIYRIDCVSTNTATGTSSRITGIYACTLAADGCQKAL